MSHQQKQDLKQTLSEEEKIAIDDLETLIGRNIPIVDNIIRIQEAAEQKHIIHGFGMLIRTNKVIELGLSPQFFNPVSRHPNHYYEKEIESLPDSIGNLTNLKLLDLCNSTLRELPDSIGNLRQLKTLYLCVCRRLRALPESIGNLSNLKTLDLHLGGFLSKLPQNFVKLSNLQTLKLSMCIELRELPEDFQLLSNLRSLSLDDCRDFNALPETFGSLSNLQTLSLNNCYKFKGLPENFGSLSNLQTLSLSNCTKITALPESFASLSNLQTLDLSSCEKLKKLTENFGNLINLRKLDIRHCSELTKLPDSFGHLKNLQDLELSFCPITELPNNFGELSNLKQLIMPWSRLKKLPQSFGNLSNLHILDLSDAQFTKIPNVLWKLKNLKEFNIKTKALKGEDQHISTNSLPIIQDVLQKRSTIHVFISHSVDDYEKYKIKELAHFLESQEEIYNAFYCERDMRDNIYESQEENIKDSQIVLFIMSKRSVQSKACKEEMQISAQNDKAIIPILAPDMTWEEIPNTDIDEIQGILGKELQIKNEEEMQKTFQEIYDYIYQYKRDFNLFDVSDRKIKQLIAEFQRKLVEIIKSTKFFQMVKANPRSLRSKLDGLNASKIEENLESLKKYIKDQ
ncbi:MAG: TIR domain-containing protein [Candidatus Lokiarchaeota archaeon]|nr:TIR domain-containing protein [Candidatus Lokiarchaeota archaeon]